jgi:divalent metal cation (Fe/Co/Zn/Cd) transporter
MGRRQARPPPLPAGERGVETGWVHVRKPLSGERPNASTIVIGALVLSLLVMPAFWAKRRTAAALGSLSLPPDAKQTLAWVLLSVGLLAGLLLNWLAGWWRAGCGGLAGPFAARMGEQRLNRLAS